MIMQIQVPGGDKDGLGRDILWLEFEKEMVLKKIKANGKMFECKILFCLGL